VGYHPDNNCFRPSLDIEYGGTLTTNIGGKLIKRHSQKVNKFDNEEYQGLSYLTGDYNNTISPSRSDDTTESEGYCKLNKKSFENDYKAKYKTEICKFWELNKECRYGGNVQFFFIVSVRLPMG
jgi:hypothetical protein